MARRLQTVIYDIDTDPSIEAFHLGFEMEAETNRRCVLKRLTMKMSRTHHYELRALASGGWTPDVARTVTQAAHGGDLVREWAALELFYDAPTDTTVMARLHDGAGNRWWWDGAAWATAGANWNTPAELVANFATFVVTDALRLGVEWQMTTTNKRVTPKVYGALIAARLMFAARSGSTAAETRSDGWMDDVIHRVLIPWLSGGIEPEVTDEQEAPDDITMLDYSNGIGDGETNYVVSDVKAVFDLDADPTMLTPLSGTWDSVEKVYTFDVLMVSCTRYAARVVYQPVVAYAGQADYFDTKLPQVLIESIDEKNDHGSAGRLLVRDTANLSAVSVPYPRSRKLNLTILLQADDHVTTWDLADSIERLMDGNGGALLLSQGTGMPVSVSDSSQLRPARRDESVESSARFDLRVWTREYHGQETTVPIIKPDGFVTTIVPAETVAARY